MVYVSSAWELLADVLFCVVIVSGVVLFVRFVMRVVVGVLSQEECICHDGVLSRCNT